VGVDLKLQRRELVVKGKKPYVLPTKLDYNLSLVAKVRPYCSTNDSIHMLLW